ncbi:MAG: hypothetical protein ACOYCA_04670 [Eggerthellaceae bacterium]|jgi:hypothetical protein
MNKYGYLPVEGTAALDEYVEGKGSAKIIPFPSECGDIESCYEKDLYDYTDIKVRRAAHKRNSRILFDEITDRSDMVYSLRYESLAGGHFEGITKASVTLFSGACLAFGFLSIFLEIVL